MSSLSENQSSLYEEQNENTNNLANLLQDYCPNFDISNLLNIEFAVSHCFLCKVCDNIPIIKFITNNTTIYICNCLDSGKEKSIKAVKGLLYDKLDNLDKTKIYKFRCTNHPDEKYFCYCYDCKNNLCNKCLYENNNICEHENKIVFYNDRDINNKIKYIIEKLNQNINNFMITEHNNTNIINESEINTFTERIYADNDKSDENEENNNLDNNLLIREGNCIVKKNDDINTNLINNNEKEEIINIFGQNNYDENFDMKDDYIDLLSLIIITFMNYPNYNLIKSISNAEKIAVLLFENSNKINLKYDVYEKNINNNSFKLFSNIFVNNNNENCFLLINEKILDLSDRIKLSDVLDINNINFPYQLEVILIERKNKPMKDLSFMFYGISSLNSESNFDDFDTTNITNMSNMFYYCSSLKKIPFISKFKTENVNNMEKMFYKCSSLVELPNDISRWSTKKVTNLNSMFEGCKSLTSLPDISNWDVSEFKYMNCMFKDCKSLTRIFDIKKWENKFTKNIEQNGIIDGCPIIINNDSNNDLLNRIKKMCKKIVRCIRYKCFYNLYCPFMACLIILGIVSIGLIIFFLIRTIYYSLDVKESIKCFNNPIEYFNINNSLNNTNNTIDEKEDILNSLYLKILDIDYYRNAYFENDERKNEKLNILLKPFLIKLANISENLSAAFDSFYIKEFGQNSSDIAQGNSTEDELKSILSQENIIEFKSYRINFICFTTIGVISILSAFLILVLILIRQDFIKDRRKLMLKISFTLFVISGISGLINYFISDKIYKTIFFYLTKVEQDFEIQIPQEFLDEKNNIEECQIINISIITCCIFCILIFIVVFCKSERNNGINPNEPARLFNNVPEED